MRHVSKKKPDLFDFHKVYLPKATGVILKEMSETLRLPLSRLVAIAVDNELDAPVPFNYPCDVPKDYADGYLYVKEAGIILNTLLSMPTGLSRDTLVLIRRDLGIPDRTIFLAALAELFDKGLVEEYKAQGKWFKYGDDYTKIRALGEDRPHYSKRFKKMEGVSLRNVHVIKDEDIER